MQISVILAHPDKNSFNHAIAHAAAQQLQHDGHAVCMHDLYAEAFDPILPLEEIPRNAVLPEFVKAHCREISEADGIIIVHPNWWGQPPAILKGWVDRVLRPGVAYEFIEGDSGGGVPQKLLKIRAALVFNTSNTPDSREQESFGDPLEQMWKDCVFGLCCKGRFVRETFSVVVTSTAQQRGAWLEHVRVMTSDVFTSSHNLSVG
jgi:NAD(P)H dehydrogenase (quinone)